MILGPKQTYRNPMIGGDRAGKAGFEIHCKIFSILLKNQVATGAKFQNSI